MQIIETPTEVLKDRQIFGRTRRGEALSVKLSHPSSCDARSVLAMMGQE